MASCFSFGTKFLLHNGCIKSVENLTKYDCVIGSDGNAKRILDLTHGETPMYEIIKPNAKSYTVGEDHMLVLKFFAQDDTPSYINLAYVRQIILSTSTVTTDYDLDTTDEIIRIRVADYMKLHSDVQKCLFEFKQDVELTYKHVELDPYILGMWLARQSINTLLKTTDIVLSEKILIDYLHDYADEKNLFIHNADNVFSIVSKNNSVNSTFASALEKYNLDKCAHIPRDYILNSREIRLKLLAGLIDSVGTCYDNAYEIVTKSVYIARDICDLCSSLGIYANWQRICSPLTNSGVEIDSPFNYIVMYGTGIEKIPVKISDKKINTVDMVVTQLTKFTISPTCPGKYLRVKIGGNGDFLAPDFTVWRH